MTGPQIGHYAPGEVEYLIEHDGSILMELDDFSFDFDPGMETGGAGLGDLQNTYHKRVKAPKGTWSITRKALQRADDGELFRDLVKGSAYIVTDEADAAATTLTTSETLVSILQVQERTAGTIWQEGVDFTVNYATSVITFVSTVPAGGVEVKYLTTTAHMKSQNLLQNTGFEAVITDIWSAFATGVIARTSTAAEVRIGTYALAVTPAAQNDGVQYDPNFTVIPGRVYRCRFWVKGTAAETILAYWTDAAGTTAMSVVSPAAGAIAGADWNEYDFTFTPDESTVLNIIIKNTTAVPHVFYVDDIYVGLNDPTVNPMDGQRLPFQFNVIARRVVDGVDLWTLKQCSLYGLGVKSGTAYTESLKGEFLDIETE